MWKLGLGVPQNTRVGNPMWLEERLTRTIPNSENMEKKNQTYFYEVSQKACGTVPWVTSGLAQSTRCTFLWVVPRRDGARECALNTEAGATCLGGWGHPTGLETWGTYCSPTEARQCFCREEVALRRASRGRICLPYFIKSVPSGHVLGSFRSSEQGIYAWVHVWSLTSEVTDTYWSIFALEKRLCIASSAHAVARGVRRSTGVIVGSLREVTLVRD